MQVTSFPARQSRSYYRHELRTLTYVTLDDGNGGIVRNLSHEGVAVQAVARLREEQRVRLRFELRFPRLRVEAMGQVSWANASGQCGIHFVELPDRTRQQINEWIFSNLLESLARDVEHPRSIFAAPVVSIEPQGRDGLIVSDATRSAIRMEPGAAELSDEAELRRREKFIAEVSRESRSELSWLSRPLSARTLAWMVDSLVLVAGMFLFALIFLSIAHELPQWQLALTGALAAAAFVAASYWALFAVLGGPSLGVRLAEASAGGRIEEEELRRFR